MCDLLRWVQVNRLRNGVVPALTEGVAAQDSAQSKVTALDRAVFFHRLHRVFRAGGHKPAAGGQHGADFPLVKADQYEDALFR